MRIKIICITIILFSYSFCYGGQTTGVRGLAFTAGSRALGMGEAHVSNFGDIYAVYFNPAGIGNIKSKQIGFTHFKSLDDTFYAFAGYGFPLKNKNYTMGCSVFYFDGGDIELNYTNGITEIKKAQQDAIVTLSIAKNMHDLHFAGMNLKIIYSKLIEDYNAVTFAMDGGVIYKIGKDMMGTMMGSLFGIDVMGDTLNAGVAIKNIGPRLQYKDEGDTLPLTLTAGISDDMQISENQKINIAFDLVRPVDLSLKVHMGIEYRVFDFLALRAGSKMGYEKMQFTSGCGFDFNVVQLDYGFISGSEMGLNHRISMLYKFK